MVKNHLKRLNTPTTWTMKRKGIIFIAKPAAGPHPRELSMPIHLLFKNLLGYAKTTRDVRNILHKTNVLVDNKQIKNHKFPVGFMDSILIKETNECFRVTLNNKGMISLNKITVEEGKKKLCKITNKTVLGKDKTQLNLLDGKNVIVDKDSYKVGDSIILDTTSNNILSHLKFEKKAQIILIGGKRAGLIGTVDDIKGDVMVYTEEGGKTFETRKKYAFVIEKSMLGKK